MNTPVWMHVFVDVPEESAETARRFWSAATGWDVGEPWQGHPEFTSLEPANADAYAHVQVIGGPARIHLDLSVDDPDGLDAERDRLVGLGATTGLRTDNWQVMASPGGLPFCLCHEPRPRRRSGPVSWPDGHRSRLTQLCIDVPPEYAELERDFWRQATGWRYRPSGDDSPEFQGKLFPPDGGSMQILLQRLGADDGAQHTRAHIDLDTDDREAEVERLVGLGARLVGPGRGGWVVLVDPAGLPFCVTVQDRELT